MPGRWTIVGVTILWLSAMGLLVHREVLPRWRAASGPVYGVEDLERLVAEPPSRWAILRDGRRVGHLRLWWDPWWEGAVLNADALLWDNPIGMLLGMSGRRQPLRIQSRTMVDHQGKLEQFEVEVKLGRGPVAAEVWGRRREDRLLVTVRLGRFQQQLNLYYSDQALWSPGLMPVDRLGGLEVGREWTWKVIDPIRGQPGTVQCSILERRTVPWEGQEVDAFVVEQRYAGVVTRTLVAADGRVLRQEVPFGWSTYTLVRLGELPAPIRSMQHDFTGH